MGQAGHRGLIIINHLPTCMFIVNSDYLLSISSTVCVLPMCVFVCREVNDWIEEWLCWFMTMAHISSWQQTFHRNIFMCWLQICGLAIGRREMATSNRGAVFEQTVNVTLWTKAVSSKFKVWNKWPLRLNFLKMFFVWNFLWLINFLTVHVFLLLLDFQFTWKITKAEVNFTHLHGPLYGCDHISSIQVESGNVMNRWFSLLWSIIVCLDLMYTTKYTPWD